MHYFICLWFLNIFPTVPSSPAKVSLQATRRSCFPGWHISPQPNAKNFDPGCNYQKSCAEPFSLQVILRWRKHFKSDRLNKPFYKTKIVLLGLCRQTKISKHLIVVNAVLVNQHYMLCKRFAKTISIFSCFHLERSRWRLIFQKCWVWGKDEI